MEPDNASPSRKRDQQSPPAGKTATETIRPTVIPSKLSDTTQQSCKILDVPQQQTADSSFDSKEASGVAFPEILAVSGANTEPVDSHEASVSSRWRDFVDEVARHANATLVSLLRNSVVLELDDEKLIIGYKNLQVFTKNKRSMIEKIARLFFNKSITIVFKESDDGLDDSLRVKHDNAKAKEIERIKTKAREDVRTAEILRLFPDAEITEITILDNTEKEKE